MENLVNICSTQQQRWYLQELGMSVGVRKWADDVMAMWQESREPGKIEREHGSQGVERDVSVVLLDALFSFFLFFLLFF